MRRAMRVAWPSRLWWCAVATAAILPWYTTSRTARATDIETYSFNTSPSGWTTMPGQWEWTEQGSNEKSWKVLLTGSNPSANYLYSPCLTVTDTLVRFDFQEHRFKFGTSGTVAPITYVPPAGQVQYTLDGITWQGVPLALWSTSGVDVPPTLNPADFTGSPTTDLLASGYGFQGMSAGYDQSNPAFIKSGFDLTLPLNSPLQFRLLADLGGQTFPADPVNPPWDVDSVQIKGVVPGPCVPEPGTLALVGIGGGLVVLARLRRTPRGRALSRSTAVGILMALAAVAVALVAAPPAEADVLFDFKINQAGGVPGGTWSPSTSGFVPNVNKWTYNSSLSRWGVLAAGVDNPSKATGALLTSPPISGTVGIPPAPAVNARISIAHSFWLPSSGTPGSVPIAAGQVQYRLNGSGAWIGLLASAFTTGTSVNVPDPVFGDSPFFNGGGPPLYVDQTDYVFPTYVPPTGTFTSLPPLVNGGASFVGQSAGFPSQFVPSQAILNINTGLVGSISSLELRFVEANLNSSCPTGAGWNIRMVAVEFASTTEPVPEPATLGLAMAGGGAACTARALRRRRSPAALEAE